jgi:hypothetical protein
MNNLNKTAKFSLVLVMCILLLFSIFFSSYVSAFAYSNKNRVLFVVADNDEKEMLEEQCVENEFYNEFYDVEILSSLSFEELNTYTAVALPYELINNSNICQVASIERIYLYGALTINEYKSVVGINDFEIDININDASNDNIKTVRQYLDESYENTTIFNVICYGKDNTLLCSIEGDNILLYKYLYNIMDNFSIINQQKKQRVTNIESKFDFTRDIGGARVYGVAHMDYTLYRDYDEQDATYDYFGIKTKVWVATSNDVKEIKTKYELPNTSDNLLETGPESTNEAGTLNISVGFGTAGPSVTIGYTVDLSNSKPKIVRTEDYTNDTVEWLLTKDSTSTNNINNATQDCIATWASLSSNSTATINVYFTGSVLVDAPRGNRRVVAGSYLQVPIRFEY